MSLWEQGGKLIENDGGTALVECDDCPCGTCDCICDDCTDSQAPCSFLLKVRNSPAGNYIVDGDYVVDRSVNCTYLYVDVGTYLSLVLSGGVLNVYGGGAGGGGPIWRLDPHGGNCCHWTNLDIPMFDDTNTLAPFVPYTGATCSVTSILG
jgi:hypothetical protein